MNNNNNNNIPHIHTEEFKEDLNKFRDAVSAFESKHRNYIWGFTVSHLTHDVWTIDPILSLAGRNNTVNS
jgi:hypothetical protein